LTSSYEAKVTIYNCRNCPGLCIQDPLEQISQISARDPEYRQAQEAFTHGGAALGRALAHVTNTRQPGVLSA
jgi:hypothetical protein